MELVSKGEAAIAAWQVEHQRKVTKQALQFVRKYPEDARRGEVVAALAAATMMWGAEERNRSGVAAIVAEALADPSTAGNAREKIMLYDGYASLGGVAILDDGRDRQVDLGVARRKLDAYAELNPNSGNSELLEKQYGDALIRHDPLAVPEHIAWLRRSGHSRWLSVADALQAKYEVGLKPIDWKFTAFDGGEIDMAKLRGKVVLVDFWGTWCTPCRMELPHIRAVYDKYRQQGFEVVGISCERDGGKALTQFMAAEKLPWILYLDTGRRGEKEGKVSYELKFAISSFPTTWLVSRDGVVVQRGVRGEAALEEAVRRELGLPRRTAQKP